MFIDEYKLMKQIESKNQVISLVNVHSEQMSKLNNLLKFINKIVKSAEEVDLNYMFKDLKKVTNTIIGTSMDYNEVLTNWNESNFKDFYKELSAMADDEELAIANITELNDLINEFKNGDVTNEIQKRLVYLQSKYESGVIISYIDEQVINDKWKVIKESDYIRNSTYYECVIYLGTINMYSDQNTIYKANRTIYLGFDFYPNDFIEKPIFRGNHLINSKVYKDIKIDDSDNKKVKYDSRIENHYEKKHVIDSKNYLNIFAQNTKKNTNREINAKLLIFPQNTFIFTPERSKVNIFKLNQNSLFKKNVKDIIVGEYIVRKKASAQDYIKKRAAEIVGSNYEKMYWEVTQYKSLLKNQMKENRIDIDGLKLKLQLEGIIVSHQLLKNWIYGETIAPRKLDKILEYFNFTEDDIERIHSESQVINNAHIQAGKEMFKILNEGINFSSEKLYFNLKNEGTFEFEVPKLGSFVILKIDGIGNGTEKVDIKNINKLYKRSK